MLLHEEVGDGVDVLRVAGAVDGADAGRLSAAVAEALGRHSGGLVLDVQQVTALSPDAVTALRDLVTRDDAPAGASVCVCGAPPVVEQALGDLLVPLTLEQAVAHLQEQAQEQAQEQVQEQVQEPSGTDRQVVPIEHSVHGPAQARRAVAACAARLGLKEEQGADLLLVVSEMVTNAVRHGSPPVELEVVADDEQVLVAVADGSPGRPQPRAADADAEGGRGMALVHVLCADHGVWPQPPGKTVWAAVRRRPEAPGS